MSGVVAIVLVATTGLVGGAATAAGHNGSVPRAVGTGTGDPDGPVSRLHITLDHAADGSAPALTDTQRHELASLGAENGAAPARDEAGPAANAQGPGTLRCDKNPHWSDARGRLDMRFNCRHHTINWGYRISAELRSVITGPVSERGTSWWRNGRHMPKNSPHTVGSTYHFHGTFKPVTHGDHVQSQDFMRFRVDIGGRTGTGTLTWASNVKAKK